MCSCALKCKSALLYGDIVFAVWQAQSEMFVAYQRQVLSNAKAMAQALMDRGFKLVSGNSSRHLEPPLTPKLIPVVRNNIERAK